MAEAKKMNEGDKGLWEESLLPVHGDLTDVLTFQGTSWEWCWWLSVTDTFTQSMLRPFWTVHCWCNSINVRPGSGIVSAPPPTPKFGVAWILPLLWCMHYWHSIWHN